MNPFVSAADPRFHYEGRIDFTDANGPVFIWQGSRIVFECTGDRVELLFDDVRGQVFFDVTIDGRTSLIELREGQRPRGTAPLLDSEGRHRVTICKRSEADAGTVRFRGVRPGATGALLASPPPEYRLRMQFFGDSITVGACSEDGATDQWEDRKTHNSAMSHAALTAAAFGADHRNIAVSGMGICEGYVDKTAGQIWDRLYPRADAPGADLAAWTPDLVLVNFGENDDSFTRGAGRPFPADFAVRYAALVRAMRAAWPRARIVLLRGGMYGGAKSERLREAWEAAVAELEREDPRVSHYVFQHWSENHPRVADHRAMADELIAWLRTQPFTAR